DLQERVQARGFRPPTYRVAASGGPSHDPWFEVEVCIGGRIVAVGRGRSKRSAERAAATTELTDNLVERREQGDAASPPDSGAARRPGYGAGWRSCKLPALGTRCRGRHVPEQRGDVRRRGSARIGLPAQAPARQGAGPSGATPGGGSPQGRRVHAGAVGSGPG